MNFRFFKCCYFISFFGLVMHFRDSGIIYGPFWGSFSVGDQLRHCTVHLSFISIHNQTIKKSIIKGTKEISLEFSVDIKEDHFGSTV